MTGISFSDPSVILGAVPDYGLQATLTASEADPVHTAAANLLSDYAGTCWRTAQLSTPKVATLRVDFGEVVTVGSVGLADLNLSAAGRIAVQTSDTEWPAANRIVPTTVFSQLGLGGGVSSIVGDPEAPGGWPGSKMVTTSPGIPGSVTVFVDHAPEAEALRARVLVTAVDGPGEVSSLTLTQQGVGQLATLDAPIQLAAGETRLVEALYTGATPLGEFGAYELSVTVLSPGHSVRIEALDAAYLEPGSLVSPWPDGQASILGDLNAADFWGGRITVAHHLRDEGTGLYANASVHYMVITLWDTGGTDSYFQAGRLRAGPSFHLRARSEEFEATSTASIESLPHGPDVPLGGLNSRGNGYGFRTTLGVAEGIYQYLSMMGSSQQVIVHPNPSGSGIFSLPYFAFPEGLAQPKRVQNSSPSSPLYDFSVGFREVR